MKVTEFEFLIKNKGEKKIKIWFGENTKIENPNKFYIIEPIKRIKDEFSEKTRDWEPCYQVRLLDGHSDNKYPQEKNIQVWAINDAELV